jgi:hypothetical protein
MSSITQGRWSCQSAAAARDRKATFSRLWNRSTNPLYCRWYAVVGECWMLSRLHGRELGPSVGDWDSKSRYPAGEKGPGAVGGGEGCERDGFRPSLGSVNDGEQIGVAARGRQRPDQVNVDVGETAVGYRYLCWL